MDIITIKLLVVLAGLVYVYVQLLSLGSKHNLAVERLEAAFREIGKLQVQVNELYMYISTVENQVKELEQKDKGEELK